MLNVPTNNKHLDELGEQLSILPEDAILGRDDVLILYKFTMYLVNLCEDQGVTFRGESFKYGVPMCLLVVKVTIDDRGYVCFINALSRLNCYKIFLSRLEDGTVEWREDKFA